MPGKGRPHKSAQALCCWSFSLAMKSWPFNTPMPSIVNVDGKPWSWYNQYLGGMPEAQLPQEELATCISKVASKLVKIKTTRRHIEQPLHGSHHLGPPPVLPGSLSQFPEDRGGGGGELGNSDSAWP